MSTHSFAARRIGLRGLLSMTSLILAACTVYPLVSDEGTITATEEPSGYPGPSPIGTSTPRPLPTMVNGGPNILDSYFATPSPDEKIAVVSITESLPVAIDAPDGFSVVGETIDKATGRTALYVVDKKKASRVRLGDDAGAAILAAMNSDYVVWFFLCDPCDGVVNGLYLYPIKDGKSILIAEEFLSLMGTVKIEGGWVSYLYPEDPDRGAARLYAYDIESGETLLITSDARYSLVGSENYVALNEGMVAWVSAGQLAGGHVLNVYDLARKEMRQLKVQVGNLRHLGVSNSGLVWWDVFWKGYDLASDEVFTVPIVPPGVDTSHLSVIFGHPQ